jgi:hypothetical protein
LLSELYWIWLPLILALIIAKVYPRKSQTRQKTYLACCYYHHNCSDFLPVFLEGLAIQIHK